MDLFISCSGDKSREVAAALHELIPNILSGVKPWLASEDISRGSRWRQSIDDKLKDNHVGLICLTSENLNSPWIYYEAGALCKGRVDTRIWTLLIDIEADDVKGPLEEFQHTRLEKNDFKKLLLDINHLAQNTTSTDLSDQFDTWWPILEGKLNKFIAPATTDLETTLKIYNHMCELGNIYREVFLPAYADAVTHTQGKPEEVLLELENILGHIMQMFNPALDEIAIDKNMSRAKDHLIRATLDCQKILVVEIFEDLNKIKANPPDGDFIAEYYNIMSALRTARSKEQGEYTISDILEEYKSAIRLSLWLLGKYGSSFNATPEGKNHPLDFIKRYLIG
jgi:hypothetical protein